MLGDESNEIFVDPLAIILFDRETLRSDALVAVWEPIRAVESCVEGPFGGGSLPSCGPLATAARRFSYSAPWSTTNPIGGVALFARERGRCSGHVVAVKWL